MATPKFVLVHWLSDPKPDCWQVIQTSCIKAKEVEVGNTYDTEWDPKEETSPATILKLGDSKAYLKQIRLHEYVEPWKQTPIGEKRKHAPKKLPDDFITESQQQENDDRDDTDSMPIQKKKKTFKKNRQNK
ncbi:hypothetical protein QZH41_001369 [Actinostola sp. cb2023]|nr:hypothetical protein QZH41_001369 [Actinostola sp. cb2023]